MQTWRNSRLGPVPQLSPGRHPTAAETFGRHIGPAHFFGQHADDPAKSRPVVQPLLDALHVQEDAARALADDLRTRIDELQGRLREAETHLEHLAITRKTVTAVVDRLPAHPVSPGLPEHPDYPASSPA
ncbi:hypothetical protein ACWD25_21850 [Streptomyces sp. NPDC002920]